MSLKRYCRGHFFVVFIFGLLGFSPVVQAEALWTELRGTHFLIYSRQGVSSSFRDQVLSRAEDHYRRMIRYFGSLPSGEFWSWDHRCRIYLYDSQTSYLQDTRQPVWSGGYAVPEKRTIVSYQNAPRFLESILPHEMAHLIFREFVGFNNPRIPHWMDEGFAVWQEQGEKSMYDSTIRGAVQSNRYFSISSLNSMKSLHGYQTDEARLFYAQAQSLVRFLLDGKDPSYFMNLCRDLRNGIGIGDALVKNFRHDFETLADLESRWRTYVLSG